MDKFERGVKEIIAQNSRFTIDEIGVSDPIDRFISSAMADRLARKLHQRFDKVDTTGLTNQLYTTIKKVSELIAKITSLYSQI